MNVHEVSHSELIYPLITQTAPPPLNYYGSSGDYDYFSVGFCKYKVLKSTMSDQFRFDFTSWDKSHRIKMNVHFFELIPQTIYESEGYNKNSRSIIFRNHAE